MATTDISPSKLGGAVSLTPVTFVVIQNVNSGLYLQPSGDGSGAQLQQQAWSGDERQQWAFIKLSDGCRIFNGYSGFCINADGNKPNPGNGTKVSQYTWAYGQKNQQWVFDNASQMFVSAYTYASPVDSWMVWDVYHQSTQPGAAVSLHSNNGGSNQKWNLLPVS